jgi:four helix bundle protein
MKRSLVGERSYAFALDAIRFYQELVGAREFVLSKQMLRSGTSIGANVEEALAALTRKEFAAKMSIASREARECHYWLRLLRDSAIAPADRVNPLVEECGHIVRILTSIVKSAQSPRKT